MSYEYDILTSKNPGKLRCLTLLFVVICSVIKILQANMGLGIGTFNWF